ncbi:D-alanine--D-alanine ligase [Bacillus thermotolerans]|uniref:D-alanine--D-alanine ligase n=1 Tax=Bacillus thermotolerans TaxID=1221996 RepID=A0A0F5HYW5_BACTR|nr:D-alanine--D-alanine ligase [Bacillus thermotolerans]KKB38225.1 D-alanine--D-alanine ligase [Bacillus thermotolerans]KKB39737.1 D-alanine--D-alanine ligase [Bacillus thermotolerans]KKB39771.1 D-alanine--D-alanine ligase [Bacillus thermotolerans]
MKTKLCLLYGGKSAEHEVSLETAKAVTGALDFNKYEVYPVYITIEGHWIEGETLTAPVNEVSDLQFETNEAVSALESLAARKYDIIFPLLHGPNGEDGTVQGMLEVMNLPYVGNGVLSSSAGMDKVIMKNIFAQAGLPQVKYVWLTRKAWEHDKEAAYKQAEQKLGYPCFVKPANLGSSVGISKCTNREELDAAYEEAFQFDRKIVVEEGIQAREIEIGLLGNDTPSCSVIGEIIPQTDFYDYKAKYKDGSTALIIPADVPESIQKNMKEMAVTAFQSLDCSGLVRADFFLKENGELVINEINTMPGFTPFSMFPLLWKHTGVDYPALIEKLIELAKERYEEKQQLKYTV